MLQSDWLQAKCLEAVSNISVFYSVLPVLLMLFAMLSVTVRFLCAHLTRYIFSAAICN